MQPARRKSGWPGPHSVGKVYSVQRLLLNFQRRSIITNLTVPLNNSSNILAYTCMKKWNSLIRNLCVASATRILHTQKQVCITNNNLWY